jgi:RNA polymerase sigma-70 factor (ECF subfamily)
MGRQNRYDGVDGYAARLIRYKARRLVGVAGFVRDDVDDIEQELVIDVLARLGRYDLCRAKRETFISRIVDHHIATLIEARRAGVRDYRREEGSLDERLVGEDGGIGESAQVTSSPAHTRKILGSARRDEEIGALRVDLEKLFAELPEDQRALCERLKTSSVTEISEETGVPRGTVYEHIGKLRSRFEKAGLAVYLDSANRLRRAPVCIDRARESAVQKRSWRRK